MFFWTLVKGWELDSRNNVIMKLILSIVIILDINKNESLIKFIN